MPRLARHRAASCWPDAPPHSHSRPWLDMRVSAITNAKITPKAVLLSAPRRVMPTAGPLPSRHAFASWHTWGLALGVAHVRSAPLPSVGLGPCVCVCTKTRLLASYVYVCEGVDGAWWDLAQTDTPLGQTDTSPSIEFTRKRSLRQLRVHMAGLVAPVAS